MSNSYHSVDRTIKSQLTQSGYKLTPQREATLEIIITNDSELLTAEEIFIKVKQKNPTIGLATVYRTLDLLTELKIVDKISFHDGMSRYELIKKEDESYNYYLLCLECKKIEDIKESRIKKIKEYVEEKNHFKIATHHLTFHGICKDCLEKEDKDG